MGETYKESFDDVIADLQAWVDNDIERNADCAVLLKSQASNFIRRLKNAVGEERVKTMYECMSAKVDTRTATTTIFVRPRVVDDRSLLEKAFDGIESIFEGG